MGDCRFNGKLGLVAEKHNGREGLQHPDGSSGCDTQCAKAIGSVWDVARDAHHVAPGACGQRRQPTGLIKT